MKHKFILFLLAVITGLSILNGIASLLMTDPNSAGTRPVEIAGNSRGGLTTPTPTPSSE